MHVAVTGASGFLGTAVRRRLMTTPGLRVTGLGHRHGGADVVALDLRDAAAWRAWLRAEAPDVVVHSAAYRDPDFCEQHPEDAEALNVVPARVLAETLPAGARLVFISSDYVFDGLNPPYGEDAPRRPVSVYGRTKVLGEDAVRAHPGALILRVPVLVGASGATLADSGYLGQLVTTVRDPAPAALDDVLVRVPTWIEDVAEAITFLIARDVRGVVHMAGPRAATRYGSAVETAQTLGLPHAHLRPSRTPPARPAARPPNSALSTAKLRAMGFTRFTPLPDILHALLAAYGDPAAR